MISRRMMMVGVLSAPAGCAEAATSAALPGGGKVMLPSGYKQMPPSDPYFEAGVRAMVAHKRWRTTMSGYPEIDGMIAAARADGFETLDAFVTNVRAALSVNWAAADEKPETRFTEKTARFRVQRSAGPMGEELWRDLSVSIVGVLQPYQKPAIQYARVDRKGLMAGIWLFKADGGLKKARAIADGLTASFSR